MHRRAITTLLGGCVLVAAAASAQTTGAELYRTACAACHGLDGRGAPASAVGFQIPLPDFTDCSFATVEPDGDWMAVAHDGGPARAFDRRMPAFGEAVPIDDLQQVIDHVREFCEDPRWPRGELNLPRPLVTEKAFPENETVLTTTVAAGGAASVGHQLLYEQRIGAQAQVEVMVPFVSHETGSAWHNGLGDVAVAFKRVLHHSLRSGRIVSASAEAVLPTGKETEGLGKGTAVFEPFLTFGQILGVDGFLQAQAGMELPGGGANEAFWRVTAGRTFVEGRFGRSWSPIIELLAAREIADGEPVHWDVVPQVQVSLSKRQHILVSGGVRIPMNDRDGRHTQILTYFLWDWFDGGLLDGWR